MTSVKEFTASAIRDNKVIVFSKSGCPYCVKTKSTLSGLNIPFLAIELDQRADGADIQNELLALTKQRTVPNVFVNGKHIGGNDSTQAAIKDGSFQEAYGINSFASVQRIKSLSTISAAVKSLTTGAIKDNKVMVFSKSYCPYCAKTKSTLDGLGIKYGLFELDKMAEGSAIQDVLLELTKQRTVPNVFVKGKHIGGNDATQAAIKDGSFQKALNA